MAPGVAVMRIGECVALWDERLMSREYSCRCHCNVVIIGLVLEKYNSRILL